MLIRPLLSAAASVIIFTYTEILIYTDSELLLKSTSPTDTRLTTSGVLQSDCSEVSLAVDVSNQAFASDFTDSGVELNSPDKYQGDHFGTADIKSKFSYKFLDLNKLTDLEQRDLKGRLTNDYMRITSKYSNLVQHVIQSLSDRMVSPKKLCMVLMNLSAFPVQKHEPAAKPLLEDNMDNIRNAEDVDDVFYILRSYGSFFDCHVVKHIVNSRLCTESDRKELEKYENELTRYCQRNIFEVPHIATMNPDFRKFVMKVDDVVLKSLEMKAIDAFRVKLAEACSLEPYTLHLCSVDKGCVQLIFQIPPCVVNLVFPLTTEQQLTLKKLGVIRLECGDYVIDLHVSQFNLDQVCL